MRMLSALALLAALAAQVRDQRSEPPRGTGTISGRVVLHADGQQSPLRRATVTLSRDGDRGASTAGTDAQGRYRFESLPAGKYRVDVLKLGFISLTPLVERDLPPDTALAIDLAVQRAGALEGRFVDDRGIPIERLTVTADRVVDAQDRRPIARHVALTDDLGRFRIHTLPPGRYLVHATPPPPASGESLFYPGTDHGADATVLNVVSGQTIERLDFTVAAAALSPVSAEALASVEREIASLENAGVTGRIAGRVTRTDLGVSVPNASVKLSTDSGLLLRTTLSDGNGAFTFAALPAGRYLVNATLAGYIPTALAGSIARGTAVTLELPSTTKRADLSLTPASAVEVRVMDEFGDPAPGVVVQMTQRRPAPGVSSVLGPSVHESSGTTDDRGWFRIPRLPTGDHYVLAVPEPFAKSGPAPFAPTYFPGTASADGASAIRVEPGADVHNVSFSLVAAASGTLSGIVVSAEGRRLPGAGLVLVPNYGGEMRNFAVMTKGTATAQGSFTFSNVPEGTYILQAFADGFFGMQPVTVSAESIRERTQVVLALKALATAKGRVIFEGGPPPTKPGEGLTVSFRPTDITKGPLAAEAVKMNSSSVATPPGFTFELRNLAYPGVLVVFPYGRVTTPFVLSRILLDGRDITDVPYDFHLGDVTGLEVIVTTRVGTVSGTITAGSETAPGVDVVAFGADQPAGANVSRLTHWARSNERGAFTLPMMLPGRYFVIAGVSPAALSDPRQLAELRSRATLVTVTEGVSTTVALTITK